MDFKDHFSEVSQEYRKYRPDYPENLFTFLSFISREHERAWDCATGTGQSAKHLAKYFSEVIATDASQAQISKAERVSNIKYSVSAAEQTTIESNSVNIISVAQALHWFNIEKFFVETGRVLKPGGVLAVWCYDILHVHPEIDVIIDELYSEILEPYWPAERKIVALRYQGVDLPYQKIQCPTFKMRADWNLHQLIGYLNTWSAILIYQKKHGVNPLVECYDKIARLWGSSDNAMEVSWTIYMKASVKPG